MVFGTELYLHSANRFVGKFLGHWQRMKERGSVSQKRLYYIFRTLRFRNENARLYNPSFPYPIWCLFRATNDAEVIEMTECVRDL